MANFDALVRESQDEVKKSQAGIKAMTARGAGGRATEVWGVSI